MKSLKSFLFNLTVLSILLVACQPTPQPIHITGKLANSEAKKVKLYNDDLEFELDVVDGVFSTTFETLDPMYLDLRIDRYFTTMYVFPGQSLEIKYDAENEDETIVYSGDQSGASSYLAKKEKNEEKVRGKELYQLDEEAFLVQLEANAKMDLDLLKRSDALPASFIEAEKINIAFAGHQDRMSFEPAHKYYADDKEFKPSEDFTAKLNNIELDNEKYIGVSNFGSFLSSFIGRKGYENSITDEKYAAESDPIIKANIDLIKGMFKNPKVKAYSLDLILKDHLSYSSALSLATYMSDIKGITSNEKTFERIEESLEKWGHLAKGQPAPDFDGMSVKGEAVKLSDLKGRNVYIDVWATWCGPCIGEQPALFELEEKYHGNDKLAFMGVSIDSDKAAWEKMIEEKEMKGEQIFTEGAWKSDICSGYLIKGIPRFILVDQNGNIIDADAPRPSSEQIKGILKELSGEPLLSAL